MKNRILLVSLCSILILQACKKQTVNQYETIVTYGFTVADLNKTNKTTYYGWLVTSVWLGDRRSSESIENIGTFKVNETYTFTAKIKYVEITRKHKYYIRKGDATIYPPEYWVICSSNPDYYKTILLYNDMRNVRTDIDFRDTGQMEIILNRLKSNIYTGTFE